jgi:hypothetical protein
VIVVRGAFPKRAFTTREKCEVSCYQGSMNTPLWTWSGQDFGDRDGDELWTYDGRHVGRFHRTEIYGADGDYLGELQRDDHLITKISKRMQPRRLAFAFKPQPNRPARAAFIGFGGFELPIGFQDFPSPGALR